MAENKYLVIKCPWCKQKHVIPSSIKTKQCSRCGKRLKVEVTTIGKFDKASDARDSIASSSMVEFRRAIDPIE
jgi:phage FluMu protein Com